MYWELIIPRSVQQRNVHCMVHYCAQELYSYSTAYIYTWPACTKLLLNFEFNFEVCAFF